MTLETLCGGVHSELQISVLTVLSKHLGYLSPNIYALIFIILGEFLSYLLIVWLYLKVQMKMMNYFCGLVDQGKVLGLVSSWDLCQRFLPSQISGMLRVGFEPAHATPSITSIVWKKSSDLIESMLRINHTTYIKQESKLSVLIYK